MNTFNKIILFISLFLAGCQTSNTNLEDKLNFTMKELQKTKTALKNFQSDPKGKIIHEVFLDLKSKNDINMVIAEIKKLSKIKEVTNLKVGTFKNLEDERAMQDYEIKFQMQFDSEKNYKTYQNDSIHLQLKKQLKQILIGPPVTYDFTIQ